MQTWIRTCLLALCTAWPPAHSQAIGQASEGWWAFEPDADHFDRKAPLDLRYLNERVAGQSGFVQVRGGETVLGSGKPVRFWGINAGVALLKADDATLTLTARRWAKAGINLMRFHGALFDRAGDDPTAVDMRLVERLHRVVQILKQEGIYTYVSFYFPLWMQLKESDGIAGAALGQHPFGLLYFEPRMQEMYRAWLRQIMATPIQGKALVDEPAVAGVEIVNEDSLFFWTFKAEVLGSGPLARLETMYAAWLEARYGGLDQAFARWGGRAQARDSVADKRATLLDAWHMTREGMKDKKPRMQDQIVFLATLQRRFYADTVSAMRRMGVKSLIAASNWTTADNLLLGGVERWTYAAADVIDKHGYFGGPHEGEASSYMVRPGQRYADKSVLLDPESLPLGYVQLAGKPHWQTEIAWNKPNRFIADGDLLVASYGGLQGVNAYVWFVASDGNWLNHGRSKWTWMMPGEIGQSYATALQYRRGDVRQADTVMRIPAPDADVLALKNTGIVEGTNADFRIGQAPAGQAVPALSGMDPLATLVGRVERVERVEGVERSGAAGAMPMATDLARFIDRQSKRLRSTTGELDWDYGKGLLRVNTPKSQAVTGFLAKAGVIQLGDVSIRSTMEYGTIHVISLDGKPLANARRILVQAFSEEQMYGFEADQGLIKSAGTQPINVRDIQGQVTFSKPRGLKSIALDLNGYARSAPKPLPANGVLALPNKTLYTVLTR